MSNPIKITTMSVTITRQMFEAAASHRSNAIALELNKRVEITGIDTVKTMKWNGAQVPAVLLSNGKRMPLSQLLAMVVGTVGVVQNIGTALECTNFIGNTLQDTLEAKFVGDVTMLPESITPIAKMPKGIEKGSVGDKKPLYLKAGLLKAGDDFDTTFAPFTILPAVYANKDGSARTNACYVIEALQA